MKKYILLAATVFTVFTLKAGNLDNMSSHGGGGDKKLILGVSVGAGIPMGAYGSKNTDTTASVQNDSTHRQNGYAKTGFHFDVTAGYLFGGNFGAMVLIGGNMNSFDAATYTTVNGIKSPYTFTATSYYAGQYLVGPCGSFGADKMKITAHILVGLVTASFPTETESASSGGASQSTVISGKGGSGFGWQIGAGIQYMMSDNLGLTFNLSYTGASINYTGYNEVASGSFYSGTYNNTTLKQSMSLGLLNVSVGIAYCL